VTAEDGETVSEGDAGATLTNGAVICEIKD